MKKLMCLFSIILLSGCVFTYDPPSGSFVIFNNSDEAMYVYLQYGESDSLPLSPALVLFYSPLPDMEYAQNNPIRPRFTSPEYRIDAYSLGSFYISGSRRNPSFPPDIDKVTLFFISETTMRNNDWDKIHRDQLFMKKAILTQEELKNADWQYMYNPIEE